MEAAHVLSSAAERRSALYGGAADHENVRPQPRCWLPPCASEPHTIESQPDSFEMTRLQCGQWRQCFSFHTWGGRGAELGDGGGGAAGAPCWAE